MRVRTSIKSDFLTGLILVAPLVITLVILRIVMGWFGNLIEPIIAGTRLATFTANNVLLAQLLTLATILALITIIGTIAQRSAGRRLFGRTGSLVNFIPVIRTIYGSIRQMTSSVVHRSSDYESVVYVEYPRPGVYQLGLKTGEAPSDMSEVAGEQVHNVFVPGSPNPTQGALILVPDSRVRDSSLTVSTAIRLLMTTGMAETSRAMEFEEELELDSN
ncbi:MAG: DUF502 domain-containing protein [Halobacteriaceae archaeon]